MIKFVICDDNIQFLSLIKNTIDNYMMRRDNEYTCKLLSNYGRDFKSVAKEKDCFKIYFLDLQMENESGVDASRFIREECEDWHSIIVIVTAYNNYRLEIMSNRLFLLDYITKNQDCEKKIEETLELAFKNYDNRPKMMSYRFNYINRQVEYGQIIYFEKEPDTKRSKIKTLYGEGVINQNIKDLAKHLDHDKRFMKISRSMIVNLDMVESFDIAQSKLTFINKEITYLVSRELKKELMERVSNNSKISL